MATTLTGNAGRAEPQIVFHPDLGKARLIRSVMNGLLWEVEFENGRRLRLTAEQFTADSIRAINGENSPVLDRVQRERPIIDRDQFTARQAIETMRYGIVPRHDIDLLTLGLKTERDLITRQLEYVGQYGGGVIGLTGDYGGGKSHTIEWTIEQALQKNMVVMRASLDLAETPPNKAHEIYRALVQGVQYPDQSDENTLFPLLRRAQGDRAIFEQFYARSPLKDNCPLVMAIEGLINCAEGDARRALLNWISGQKHDTEAIKTCIRRPANLRTLRETAKQYVYLLSGISVLATLCGYSGLAILLDESELYSQVKPDQRERADQFFKAMIFAAVGDNKHRLSYQDVPDNPQAPEYNQPFAPQTNLFFMFTQAVSSNSTRDKQMPIDRWLLPSSQLVELESRFTEGDLRAFLRILLEFHQKAYQYTILLDRYEPTILETGTILSRALRDGESNPRRTIRICIEVLDRMFLDKTLTDTMITTQLRAALRLT